MFWRRVGAESGRKTVAAALLIGGLTTLALGVARSHPAASAPMSSGRPNVVVVMTDDQRVDDVRYMRSVRRRLAARGVTFEQNFATFPLCCPSRSTFFTGEYAHNHRVVSNEPPAGGEPRFRRIVPKRRTLPVRLHHAGYRTALVGKYLNSYGSKGKPRIPPGWDIWHVLVGGSADLMYGYTLNDNGHLRRFGDKPRDYEADVLSRKADEFIRHSARHRRPFFLELAPLAPHVEPDAAFSANHPHRNPRPAPRDLNSFNHKALPKPPSFNEEDRSDKPFFIRKAKSLGHRAKRRLTKLYRSRLESLQSVDDAVRHLIGALRRSGELGNTVVVFTSDNGYMLGEHRQVGKELPYEESERVPLIIRGPGFPEGVARRAPVGNIDLAPTIVDLAKASRKHMDGVSLLPLASDPGAMGSRAILYEKSRKEGRPYKAVRTRNWVLIRWAVRHGIWEMYDLANDPYELQNVADDPAYAAVRQSLKARLEQLKNCEGVGCR
jgi:N-acetylglucosamine-6-sulfatase